MSTRVGGAGRWFVGCFALACALGAPGCGGAAEPGEDAPQSVEDESVEESRAGGPVKLNTGTVTAQTAAIGGGFAFVTDHDLDSSCDANGYLRRVPVGAPTRGPGEAFVTVPGAVLDVEVVGSDVWYSVLSGCGLNGGYIARRPIAGGAETIVLRVASDASDNGFLNSFREFEVRGGRVYALVDEGGRTTVRTAAMAGGAMTVLADLSAVPDGDSLGFENLQVDANAVYLHEQNHGALWRIPLNHRGSLASLPRFPNVQTSVGDYVVANGKVYFTATDLTDRVQVQNADGTGAVSTLVFPGARLRAISDLAADASNLYFFAQSDRSIYRYDLTARRLVRVVRALNVDPQPGENNLVADATHLYWMQLNSRTNREEGVAVTRLAKSWAPAR